MPSTLFGGAVMTLVALVLVTLVLLFVGSLLIHRDVEEAGQRTAKRSLGFVGAGGALAGTAATLGVEVVAQLPELAITFLGVGALLTDLSIPVFLALAFVIWAVAESVNGGPYGA